MLASSAKHEVVALNLIKNGTDLEKQTAKGNTALTLLEMSAAPARITSPHHVVLHSRGQDEERTTAGLTD